MCAPGEARRRFSSANDKGGAHVHGAVDDHVDVDVDLNGDGNGDGDVAVDYASAAENAKRARPVWIVPIPDR